MRSPVSLFLPTLLGFAMLSADEAETIPGYPAEVRATVYPVPEDASEQPTLYWFPEEASAGEGVPLLVALHTWGGNYRQAGGEAIYAEWCLQNGWAFVHPNFRGPNLAPEALGSDLTIADIRAVVEWARGATKIDATRIYAVGASGGGHATQLLAGRLPEIWAGISSWCGISDIAAWHEETSAAGRIQYAANIESAIGGPPDASDETLAEAAHRSPLSWLENASGVPLDLSHGVTDGGSGSVPFTHSLHAWNAVVPEPARFSAAQIEDWYADPGTLPKDAGLVDPLYGANPPVFRKTHGNTRITIFEGGHQILHEAALNWLAAQRKGEPANWNPPKIGELKTSAEDKESGK